MIIICTRPMLQLSLLSTTYLDIPCGLVCVGRHEDLFQLALSLQRCDPFLLDVAVSGFPHEEVLDDVPHRFPGQKVITDVVEVFTVFLDGLLKEIGL